MQNSNDIEKIKKVSNQITELYKSACDVSEFVKADFDKTKEKFHINYIKNRNSLQTMTIDEKGDEIAYGTGSHARHTLAKNALQGLKMARGNLIDSIAKIGYNEALSEKLTAIEKQITESEALIATEESKKTELTVTEIQVKSKISELKKALQNPQHIDKTKLILREYIERITVYNNKIELTVKVSFFFTSDDGKSANFDYNHTIFGDRLSIENNSDRLSNNSRKSLVHRNLLVFGGVGVDTEQRKTPETYSFESFLVPVAGLEPARCRHRWILSPLRLPIPSHRQIDLT